ncbi:MAG: family 20 glycosylhydrolase [Lentisphaerae bacterium]|jgi:hypothetical protein|nr:family 20 glycosylhydrolase [Lentisphaerota bacterium]MBT4821577.1 family 20 glycosylhydrolase [Lentisphaerota bacterium]MBT5604567.1 family 20 glycosylhydrolase [Lentisphaerota bacterium]MBT7061740.1 family 20 glycosylhydrolase [Lentisphaerota bacterium]MBT7848802.1 family 20 glycosylhydrolase [Lentisphaerota bacterium]
MQSRCFPMLALPILFVLFAGDGVGRTAGPRPLQHLLFDFENGVEGWLGNPWGGGKCGPEGSEEAALGDACLRGWYRDVERGANVICPYLAKDAAWRALSWGGISFYFRGDGSPAKVTVTLATDEKTHSTYSKSVALEDTSWHRVYLPFSTFWNRGRQRFNVARLQRFYFGSSGTHEFRVDHIQLEAPHRVVPLHSARTVRVPVRAERPAIDGVSAEKAWNGAAVLEPFSAIDGGAPAKEQTSCRLFHDGTTLFIAATLHTATPGRLKATLTRHDADVWTDDAFEIFITGADAETRFYQFAVNPLGTRAELSTKDRLAFDHDWRAATSRTETGWHVEVALPLGPLVGTPDAGLSFGVNFARENRVTGELSCWSPTGKSFLRPDRFGRAVLWGTAEPIPIRPPDLRDYGAGIYALPTDPLVVAGEDPGASQTWQATIRLPGGEQVTGKALCTSGDGAVEAPLIALSAEQQREGDATVEFLLSGSAGQPLAYQARAFRIFLPPAAGRSSSVLPLTPAPKELLLGEGILSIPPVAEFAVAGPGNVDDRVTRFLTREVERWYGVSPTFRQGAADRSGIAPNVVLYAHTKGTAPVPGARLGPQLARRLDEMPPDGYVLDATGDSILIGATGGSGLYYGVQTLLQAIDLSSTTPSEPQLRRCRIIDWPSLTWRAVSHPLPTCRWGHPNDAPVSADFFCDYIERSIARRKLNALVLLIRQGFEFETHPEIKGPAAWSKEELRKVIDTCRAHFIEPIPLVDSYGHAAWLSLSHKELWEDGRHKIVCPRHPDTFKILTDVYGELIQLFEPARYFHIGLDEVWWKTLDTPEEKRCKRCAGVPKWQLFADHTNRLHAWFGERGIRTMMWSDVLLKEHNGGAPYHGAKALDMLPPDILQTNWSITLASGSNQRLRETGYEVWQSNSRGVNREQAQFCTGNMFGIWSKISWWSEAPWRSGGAYSYLNLPLAGEYSWNLWPAVDSTQPGLTRAQLAPLAEGAMFRDACAPEPNAGRGAFTVSLPANMSTKGASPPHPDAWFGGPAECDLRHIPRGNIQVGGATFNVSDGALDCVAAPADEAGVVIPLGRKVASLRFLHTTRLDPEHETAFLEGFKKGANWRGIPAGDYVIAYADGASSTCPILYANNTSRWELGERFPYAFRSCGNLLAATETMRKENPDGRNICLYVAQWVNPRPGVVVRSIGLRGTAQATPVLFAISGRAPRE